MFRRRIVITVPRSGIAVIAGAVIISLTQFPYYILSSLALITTIIALAIIVEARYQLHSFRYEIREKITAKLANLEIPSQDLRESVEAVFDEVIDDDTATTLLRLSKRPNSS
jgi:hypothetical protein